MMLWSGASNYGNNSKYPENPEQADLPEMTEEELELPETELDDELKSQLNADNLKLHENSEQTELPEMTEDELTDIQNSQELNLSQLEITGGPE